MSRQEVHEPDPLDDPSVPEHQIASGSDVDFFDVPVVVTAENKGTGHNINSLLIRRSKPLGLRFCLGPKHTSYSRALIN